MRRFITLALVLSLLLVGFNLSCAKPAPVTITWKVLSSWPQGYPEIDDYLLVWMERVNEAAEGQLKLEWLGGPEAVHPFEQLKAAQTGLCDVLFTHPAYHPEVVSAGQASDLFYASPSERAAAGWNDLMAEVYEKRAGVKYISPFASGIPYQVFLKKKIDKADLSGLKIRATPFYRPLVEGLGGATVQMPTGEIYTAMQRGVIDGFCSPGVYPIKLKLYEVTEYAVLPGFGEVTWITPICMDSWKELPKDLQDTVVRVTVEFEEEMRPIFIEYWHKELEEIQKQGMEIIELPPLEADKWLKVYHDGSWEELVLKPDPEFGPRLKELADKIAAK